MQKKVNNFKLGKLIISIGEKSVRKYTAPDFLNVKQLIKILYKFLFKEYYVFCFQKLYVMNE